MTISIVCSALLAALVFVLGANVTRMRVVTAKAAGSQQPSDPADRLLIAIRAHGNATEYIPVLIVLFLLVGFRSPAWPAAILIIVATALGCCTPFGMLGSRSLAVPNRLREAGAGFTYLAGLALAVTAATTL